jgi:hypothetical protein
MVDMIRPLSFCSSDDVFWNASPAVQAGILEINIQTLCVDIMVGKMCSLNDDGV